MEDRERENLFADQDDKDVSFGQVCSQLLYNAQGPSFVTQTQGVHSIHLGPLHTSGPRKTDANVKLMLPAVL